MKMHVLWLVFLVSLLVTWTPAVAEGAEDITLIEQPDQVFPLVPSFKRGRWSVDGCSYVYPDSRRGVRRYEWRQKGWEEMWHFRGDNTSVLSLKDQCFDVALGGNHVYAAYTTASGKTGKVLVLSLETGRLLRVIGQETSVRYGSHRGGRMLGWSLPGAYSVDVTPDERWLVSGHKDGTVRYWNARRGIQKRVYIGHSAYVWTVRISPRGDRIVSAQRGFSSPSKPAVHIWGVDGSDPNVVKSSSALASFGTRWDVAAATFSPDSELLVLSGADGQVGVRDMDDLQNYVWLRSKGLDRAHSSHVPGLSFSRDGAWLLTGGGVKYKIRNKRRVLGATTHEPAMLEVDAQVRLWRVRKRRDSSGKSLIVVRECARFKTTDRVMGFYSNTFLPGGVIGSINRAYSGSRGHLEHLCLWPDPRDTLRRPVASVLGVQD